MTRVNEWMSVSAWRPRKRLYARSATKSMLCVPTTGSWSAPGVIDCGYRGQARPRWADRAASKLTAAEKPPDRGS